MHDSQTNQIEACESLIREHRRMEKLLAQLEQGLNDLVHHTPEGMAVICAVMAEIEPEMNAPFCMRRTYSVSRCLAVSSNGVDGSGA